MLSTMSERTAEPGVAQALIELWRARLLSALDRPLERSGGAEPLPAERLAYLVAEGEDLYYNELAWEELTDEELVSGGRFTELVFPGFLAFIDGLLQAPEPRRDVVEELLTFLGERYTTLAAEIEAGADCQRTVWSRWMTGELIDLVLCRLYRITPAEREHAR